MNLDDYSIEGAVLLEGLEDAIIGVVEEFGGIGRILYSKSKILQILMERDNMSDDEALEYYYYNIFGLYVNEQNAIFLVD